MSGEWQPYMKFEQLVCSCKVVAFLGFQRISFIVLSSVSAVLMLCVALIVVFIQFYYYDVTDMEPLESFNFTRKADVLRVHNGRKYQVYSLKDSKLLFSDFVLRTRTM